MWYMALYGQFRAGAQIISPESKRGLGHVTPTIFGSTVGYPSDSGFLLYDPPGWRTYRQTGESI